MFLLRLKKFAFFLLLFKLLSMHLLFISVLNNSPESSKRRDSSCFRFYFVPSQQFLLCAHTRKMYAIIDRPMLTIYSNKNLVIFYDAVAISASKCFCVPSKKKSKSICSFSWSFLVPLNIKDSHDICLLFTLKSVFFYENRTAHAWNIKHGQTNPYPCTHTHDQTYATWYEYQCRTEIERASSHDSEMS